MKSSEKEVKEFVIEDFFIWGQSTATVQSDRDGSHADRMWLLVTTAIQKGTLLSIYFRTIKKSIKVTNQSWELNLNNCFLISSLSTFRDAFSTPRSVFSLVLVTHGAFLKHLF